ncbi:AAA family ATPase [Catenuloplanes japonicus]|uniref:AAA family ATPase n=1 Tax=Catenuloplanes japonicus TaxID=33876 RepID=UPI00052783D8|nr:AAA family ATPase [Catenuloplanes japonicus]
MPDLSIPETAQQVTDQALLALQEGRDVIIRAHAGAGKTGGRTSGTIRMAAAAAAGGRRVALLVAQNDQLVETIRRLTDTWPALITTLVPASSSWDAMPVWIRDRRLRAQRPNLEVARNNPVAEQRRRDGDGLFVMTLSKFGYLAPSWEDLPARTLTAVDAFDVVIVDEAWMAPAAVWRNLNHLARQVVLIGDPGQIMPWEPDSEFYPGMAGSPIEALPDLVRRERAGNVVELDLAVTRRNPSHTTKITGLLPAYAAAPTRPMFDATEVPITLGAAPLHHEPADGVLNTLVGAGMALYRLPGAVAPQSDRHVAAGCAQIAARLLNLGAELGHPDGARMLTAEDIAIVVAHHDQRAAAQAALADAGLRGTAAPRVATFNTLQGATVAVSIMWHPLSGRADVSAFHSDAGRLTVGLTRHTHGCVIVSRDGVGDRIAAAAVADDIEGDATDLRYAGLRAHDLVWQHVAG